MIDPSAFIHETAVVIGDVHLGARVERLADGGAARVTCDRIEVGDDSNVQDGAVLHCDDGIPCIVGKRVTIGHRAIVHGALVQDDVLIGMGAIVLNKVVVGRGSLIGAGAVVAEGTVIPPDSLVLGVPAKVVRTLNRRSSASGWRRARVVRGDVRATPGRRVSAAPVAATAKRRIVTLPEDTVPRRYWVTCKRARHSVEAEPRSGCRAFRIPADGGVVRSADDCTRVWMCHPDAVTDL